MFRNEIFVEFGEQRYICIKTANSSSYVLDHFSESMVVESKLVVSIQSRLSDIGAESHVVTGSLSWVRLRLSGAHLLSENS